MWHSGGHCGRPLLNDDVGAVPDSNSHEQPLLGDKEQPIGELRVRVETLVGGTRCRSQGRSIILEQTAGREPLQQRLALEDPRLDTFN